MQYNKYNTWGTLRDVMLGTYFYPEFFSKIKNSKVREPLMRMAEEINQDLEGFEFVLRSHGVNIIRATQPDGFFNEDDPYIAPLQVRNTHAVVGDTMIQFNPDWYLPIDPILRSYCNNVLDLTNSNSDYYVNCMNTASDNYNPELDVWYQKEKYVELAGSSWPTYSDYVKGVRSSVPKIQEEMSNFKLVLEYETKELSSLQGPNVISLPDSILVAANEYCDYANFLKSHITDSRPIQQFVSNAGHVDGCFAVLGNKTILSIDQFIDYSKYFPGYTVITVDKEFYQDKIREFKLMKQRVNGAWWLAGEEHNDQFIEYVETKLKSWVGYVAESVFDVNVLALNENTICVSNITPDVERKLKSRGIDCVVVPWRHRFFVDGGLHCITLDLNRDN